VAEPTRQQQNYYRRWLIQIGRQARANVRELVVGLIIALTILLLQVINGTGHSQDFRLNAISTFWPYIAAIGLYVAYAAIRAPLILDRERANEIECQAREIAALTAPRFQTTLKNVGLSFRPNEQTRFHARVEIRNISGERTTLRDMTLACVRGPAMALTNPDRKYLLASADALETGTHCDGNVVFVAPSRMGAADVEALKGTEWQFTFTDIRGQRYGSNICELTYP